MTDPAETWERPPTPTHGPRRASRLVLLVVVALAGGFFAAQGGGIAPTPGGLVIEEASDLPSPAPLATAAPLAELRGRHLVVSREGWEEAVVSPLEQRSGALTVWTGKRLFVWGGIGERPFADGAIYDPRTREWEPVAPSDLPPRSRAVGTWSGREVIVAGGRLYDPASPYPSAAGRARDAAAYNPATDTWRVLPSLPFVPRKVFTADHRVYAVSLQARARPVAVLDTDSSTWEPAPLDAASAGLGSSSVSRGGPRSSRGLAAAPPAPQRRVAPPAPVGKARHR